MLGVPNRYAIFKRLASNIGYYKFNYTVHEIRSDLWGGGGRLLDTCMPFNINTGPARNPKSNFDVNVFCLNGVLCFFYTTYPLAHKMLIKVFYVDFIHSSCSPPPPPSNDWYTFLINETKTPLTSFWHSKSYSHIIHAFKFDLMKFWQVQIWETMTSILCL